MRNLYFLRRKIAETLTTDLRFTNEMVWYIQALSKKQMHREYAGYWQAYRSLTRVCTDRSTVSTAVQFGLHGVKRALQCATRLLGRAN